MFDSLKYWIKKRLQREHIRRKMELRDVLKRISDKNQTVWRRLLDVRDGIGGSEGLDKLIKNCNDNYELVKPAIQLLENQLNTYKWSRNLTESEVNEITQQIEENIQKIKDAKEPLTP